MPAYPHPLLKLIQGMPHCDGLRGNYSGLQYGFPFSPRDFSACKFRHDLISVSQGMGCETSRQENLRPYDSADRVVSHLCALSGAVELDI